MFCRALRHAPVRLHSSACRGGSAALVAVAATCSLVGCGSAAKTGTNEPSASQHIVRRITGNGDTQVGALQVPQFSVLYWHSSKPPMRIAGTPGLQIAGQPGTQSGATTVASGSYSGVRVTTSGRWFIEVRSSGSGS
jgi:hypothetical protein